MREPNKIAFVGDWHGNEFWSTSIIDSCERNGVDTILHVGDYGFDFSYQFRDWVELACAENDVMIYFVDGNHDHHEYIWAQPGDEDGLNVISEHVRYLPRGYTWEWWGKKFLAVGGAHSVDKPYRVDDVPASWWPTETLTKADVEYAKSAGKVDVMISHDCPTGVKIPGITDKQGIHDWGEQMIMQANKHRWLLWDVWHTARPELLVHGHYHTRYETKHENTHVIGLAEDGTSWYNNVWIARNASDLQ